MKKIATITFTDFLKVFPRVKLPVVLTEEAQSVFSKENQPLSKLMIEKFIVPIDEEIDEFTEYIPCFRIPKTGKFNAIVFWKAGLMNYQYILATFDKKGKLIDKKTIAGTEVKNDSLLRTVATIKEDWTIPAVVGVAAVSNDTKYDPATTLTSAFELDTDGTILVVD